MMSAATTINRRRAFVLLAVAYFMTVVDLTIVNTSLPTIGRDLHFSQTSLQWVARPSRVPCRSSESTRYLTSCPVIGICGMAYAGPRRAPRVQSGWICNPLQTV
jgi:MFS family permease